ncbi:MAG: GTP 3',8-cyclase MoaA [Candidatus Aminicenantia bacterium]
MEKTKSKKELIDGYKRKINYLRISVTDRCNLKCIYCLPPEGISYIPREEILTFEEILQISNVAASLGISKIRLTGGEVFVRKGIIKLISSLNKIKGIKDISLTTNGTLLFEYLQELKEIGIKRLNISLDSLDKNCYQRLTGKNELNNILKSLFKAVKLGFKIKINTVIINGINEAEIPEFIQFSLENPIEVRFIEFMPLCGQGWKKDYFLSSKEIKQRIKEKYKLTPLSFKGVARQYLVSNGNGSKGIIGLITPISNSFCSHCCRLRLSVGGKLRPCLFSSHKVNLLPILKGNYQDSEKRRIIEEAFHQAVVLKPGHSLIDQRSRQVYIRSVGG